MSTAAWHVLGSGSLGTLWACRLVRAGLPVHLLLRDASRLERYLSSPGLQLLEGADESTFRPPAGTAEGREPISQLLLACKAYDAVGAITAVRHRLAPGAQVLLLQNGLGSQQAVAAALPDAQVYVGSTTEGAWQRSDGAVVFAGQGFTWVGSLDRAEPPAWLEDLAKAGIPHGWAPDIMARLWRKLAVNCAINPLTVLLECRNGELSAHGAEVARLCEELARLAQAAGHADAAAGLATDVEQVIAATAANYSSMYQDVTAGRRTEISYLLGYACDRAATLGVAVPALDSLRLALVQVLRAKGLPTD